MWSSATDDGVECEPIESEAETAGVYHHRVGLVKGGDALINEAIEDVREINWYRGPVVEVVPIELHDPTLTDSAERDSLMH